jgi:hypothetical protein
MRWLDSAISCPDCGAMHQYRYADTSTQEDGQQDCLACGKKLIGWNDTRTYADFKLVKPTNG